jgi:hypothetical protein
MNLIIKAWLVQVKEMDLNKNYKDKIKVIQI